MSIAMMEGGTQNIESFKSRLIKYVYIYIYIEIYPINFMINVDCYQYWCSIVIIINSGSISFRNCTMSCY